ncbi:hypothetical protein [Spiroplasma endosymbiont of Virgichneumon dumeticola]|uniref:hypothetical protein n=1 Tax=Spiroplasma endosymbiont of Virgichneumon dumeticola TaxID=3139323 RepID=UPI0035C9240D
MNSFNFIVSSTSTCGEKSVYLYAKLGMTMEKFNQPEGGLVFLLIGFTIAETGIGGALVGRGLATLLYDGVITLCNKINHTNDNVSNGQINDVLKADNTSINMEDENTSLLHQNSINEINVQYNTSPEITTVNNRVVNHCSM